MKIIVTGASGQIGSDLVTTLQNKHEVFGLNRNQLDVTDSYECLSVVESIQPDVIIHCAAYTSVDLAETEKEKVFLVNAMGTRNIAIAAEKVQAKVCYISTDYVFDGRTDKPYQEKDQTDPQSVYGKSKLAGEEFIQTICSKFFIVRTSWVFGLHGNNFVKTMIKLASEKDSIKVVKDQVGSPTYTLDLSHFLSDLIETEKYGIYHATNSGHCSWYEYAKAVFEESNIAVEVVPCSTSEFPRPAPRPSYSVLEHSSIRSNGFIDLRHWRIALQQYIKELKETTL
jgi:dTDP-4-dehydrorhamnose reductase